MARFRERFKNPAASSWIDYMVAANYCFEYNLNLKEGLKWSKLGLNKRRSFNTLAVYGLLLHKNNRLSERDKVFNEAIPLGNKIQLSAFGDRLFGLKFYKNAIGFYKRNAENNPKDPGIFFSVGKAYKFSGNKEGAIRNLKKVLSMNPSKTLRSNTEKLLKELGTL